MPKGYWIPHLDVHNIQGFQAYRDLADAGHQRFGSKLLARGGRREVVEGKMRSRNVLREFNSFDEAVSYYHGPDYSKAHPLREPFSACDFLIVEGYDGTQPTPIGTQPAQGKLKGYWIVHLDVHDPEAFKRYQAATAEPFGKYGARFLIRGGRQQVTEGQSRSACVVLEFPSYDAALACYRCPEYQAAIELRRGNSDADFLVIEAYDGA
jgi:uncharacterized protein (DUF1330 family)